MKITVISGSRADYGLLEWPIRTLKADPFFDVTILKMWDLDMARAIDVCDGEFPVNRPDIVLLLGDRFEILGVAAAAHLRRIPIAHIGGGDVTEGSYDDAMRDCISRMASIHFATSTGALVRLNAMGVNRAYVVGNPALDYIMHAEWRRARPITDPYVVVSYQAETIDRFAEWTPIWGELLLEKRRKVFIQPNRDAGSWEIRQDIEKHKASGDIIHESLPHDQFLNLIAHCEEFIGNSSAMLYEAPELGIKTRMIGKRQRGRAIPEGDGKASERIARILKYTAL